ncbi:MULTISPECIES: L-methionine/branched-chain amino acid transporter [Vibrio]|uniref:L-methionine/branched-chain amino acid transporter n=1 Tax=Vibrio casei TaxID=673372 RepID=A0A368LJI0_9VIBR|nr:MULTISPECIES: L-methionine/branched-chain amino acid transporter [Vibrio]RCS70503.1 L-methionine/branched-chain amino acid transporter [Vibrio casei]SJN27956.1 Amino acid transporter [Vibrio casei]HBV77904.1 L-methionine/branched-chain amino acid transporter [Vibrio sp.]
MSQQLKQDITLLGGIGQLSTTLLGTGLFMIPAIAANIAGEWSLWAWIILLFAICPIALTFALMGRQYPNAGGTAYFVRQAFNSKMERSVAWLFLSVLPVGIPAAITLAGGFGKELLPHFMSYQYLAELFTLALILILTLLGSKSSSQFQVLIALSIFALVAVFFWQGDISLNDIAMPRLNTSAVLPIGLALAVMFWCFVGIEAFSHMGEEFKNPQRDFPIAIVLGCFLAGFIYWACSVVILKFHAFEPNINSHSSIPWLSEQLLGNKLAIGITLIGYFACFSSINLYTQSMIRLVWAQAREYRPTSTMATLSKRGVPTVATFLVTIVLFLSISFGHLVNLNLELLVKLANSVFVMLYLLAMLSAFRLLTGFAKYLAGFSTLLCTIVFLCLGWSMLYAITIFSLLMLPWKKWLNTSKKIENEI